MPEQVPSWQVTTDMLDAWGFPVRRTEKVVGSQTITQRGMAFHEAKHAAWAAGFVRIESMPDAERARRRAAFHAGIEEMRQEAIRNLAHLRKHGLIVGPSHNREVS